jgi:hypothetical protein
MSGVKAKAKKLSSKNQIGLNTLVKAIEAAGTDPPASNHIPHGVRAVPVETWRYYYYAEVPAEDEEAKEARKKAFQRAREALQGSEPPVIKIWTDLVWILKGASMPAAEALPSVACH